MQTSKTDWQKLSRQDDSEIDYSDIPETDEKFWEKAELVMPHKKVDYTLKIDEDIALWLKSKGTKSSQAVNNLLRAYYIVNL
jgi:uncharacterized protein (DUF4415 family)